MTLFDNSQWNKSNRSKIICLKYKFTNKVIVKVSKYK